MKNFNMGNAVGSGAEILTMMPERIEKERHGHGKAIGCWVHQPTKEGETEVDDIVIGILLEGQGYFRKANLTNPTDPITVTRKTRGRK